MKARENITRKLRLYIQNTYTYMEILVKTLEFQST